MGGPDAAAGEMEICGPLETDRHRMTIAESSGIEAKLSTAEGNFVYEMKIPLAESRTHPFAIGTKAATTLGIELESSNKRPTERRSEVSESEGRESRGGGMRGGGGMPGGGAGGYPAGGGYQGTHERVPGASDAVKYRFILHLAGSPQSVK